MRKNLRLSATLGVIAASMLCASPAVLAASYKGESAEPMAMAAAPVATKSLHDGFYVGLAGGYDSYRVRRSTSLPGGTFTENPVTNPAGWVGGLFAGYGQSFQNLYYLGGELFVNDSNASAGSTATSVVGTYKSKFEVNTSYGLALLPGLKVNDSSLFYLRVGYNWANLKGKEIATIAGVSTAASKSNTQGGFNYGLGIETAIYENLSLRGEFTHTDYSSFTSALGTKWSPSDNQFMLGLAYHFA